MPGLGLGGTSYSVLSAATTNAAAIKAAPGFFRRVTAYNTTASAKFIRFYNKATLPVPASDTALIVLRFGVPANGLLSVTFTDEESLYFSSGIGIAMTGAVADNDTTALAANDLVVNVLVT